MFRFVEKDAILFKDTVIVLANVDASSDFMVNYVKAVFHYLVVNMAIVTCPLNVCVTKVGMDSSVRNPFVALIVIKQEDIVNSRMSAVVD